MAHFAALDFSSHSLTRINKYIRHKKMYVTYLSISCLLLDAYL